MYNPKSMKAEEFINHEEILETLDYAEKNKNNLELVDAIIDKAEQRKGLSHKEASVLLACEDEQRIKRMYDLAEQIKKDFYGNRIVMVCAALPVKLLRQRLCVLSVSFVQQAYKAQKAHTGGSSKGSNSAPGYGT